ncbi:MAG: hypothetical protein QUS12_04165 [Methanosarcina sp.]|nr:hypothetical protein [Methanosarcina sp.]
MSLSLADLAAMSYEEFQKIIDEEGKIDPFQWFKNANLFYGLQDEIRNLIVEMEA